MQLLLYLLEAEIWTGIGSVGDDSVIVETLFTPLLVVSASCIYI